MVSPSPDFQRRINNTDNIVSAQKAHLVPGLFNKYPGDYVDTYLLNNLKIKKPWIEPILEPTLELTKSRKQLKSSGIQSLVVTGGDKIAVICVDFSDRPSSVSATTIHNRFFGTTGKTFRNYFVENSHGVYTPDGIVVGNKWYRAPHTYAYYRDGTGCDHGMGPYPNNTQKLFEDVLDLIDADSSITNATLSALDIDGDGYLNRVIVLHAGSESAYGGSCNEIWAHAWGMSPKTVKGRIFSSFAVSAEYLNVSSDTQRSGIDCHEYGHNLGLPDLYDYSNNTNGVGMWSLMGSGTWGSDYGITPVHLDAWSKYRFGWVNAVTSPTGLTYIDDIETHNQIFKYLTSESTEYFLVENRQNIGFDSYLPGNGLLIWHINEIADQHSQPCHTVSLIQADGLKDLENKRNGWDSGDPYPGSENNRSFSISTVPNSSMCNGTLLDMSIANISDSSNRMSFNSIPFIPHVLTYISPSSVAIFINTTQRFTAIDQYNNPITSGVIWYKTGVGTIDTTGLYSAGATAETVTVFATYLGVTKSASATVTVPPILTSISPSSVAIFANTTQQFTAIDQYNNPITSGVIWYKTGVGTIDTTGLYSAGATAETVTVSATYLGVARSASVTVTVPPILTFIFPDTVTILTNATQQFTAIDQYNNPITLGVTWVKTFGVGFITSIGLYAAGSIAGNAEISAIYSGVTKYASITVAIPPPVLTTITITQESGTTIHVGETLQYTTSPKDQYDNPIIVTITWTSSNSSVATINSSGLATATGIGICTIRAQNGSIFDVVSIVVIAAIPVLTTIKIFPTNISFQIGDTQQLTVICKDQDANTMTCPTLTWSNTDTSVATVSSTGSATATSIGSTIITASALGIVSNISTVTTIDTALITSTGLTVSTNLCTEMCTVSGVAYWTNNGDIVGTLDPAILINTVPMSIGLHTTINPGQTVPYTFSLPDLTVGTYDICAYPGTHCQTVVVNAPPVAEAEIGIFMVVGLAIGTLFMKNKKV